MNSSAGSHKVLTHTILADAELKSWSPCILIHLDVPFEGKIDSKEKLFWSAVLQASFSPVLFEGIVPCFWHWA